MNFLRTFGRNKPAGDKPASQPAAKPKAPAAKPGAPAPAAPAETKPKPVAKGAVGGGNAKLVAEVLSNLQRGADQYGWSTQEREFVVKVLQQASAPGEGGTLTERFHRRFAADLPGEFRPGHKPGLIFDLLVNLFGQAPGGKKMNEAETFQNVQAKLTVAQAEAAECRELLGRVITALQAVTPPMYTAPSLGERKGQADDVKLLTDRLNKSKPLDTAAALQILAATPTPAPNKPPGPMQAQTADGKPQNRSPLAEWRHRPY